MVFAVPYVDTKDNGNGLFQSDKVSLRASVLLFTGNLKYMWSMANQILETGLVNDEVNVSVLGS